LCSCHASSFVGEGIGAQVPPTRRWPHHPRPSITAGSRIRKPAFTRTLNASTAPPHCRTEDGRERDRRHAHVAPLHAHRRKKTGLRRSLGFASARSQRGSVPPVSSAAS